MGKRSSGTFPRSKYDRYQTWDPNPVRPLLRFLPEGTRFFAPCAGQGHLVRQLEDAGHTCVAAFDISLDRKRFIDVRRGDATRLEVPAEADMTIENPPWTRELLHPIILNLYWQRPTWLLFDADWAYTDQAQPYMPLCRKIVAAGRPRWVKGSKHDSKDDVAWYLFTPVPGSEPQLYGRRG